MSVLAGVPDLVDEWLSLSTRGQPPHYRHRSAALALSRRGKSISGTEPFLRAAFDRIHANWQTAREEGYSRPSRHNWRWRRHLEVSPDNKSPEVRLERSIVRACGEDWSNQMPTASGLVGPTTDKRAAVDLIERVESSIYSLVELKVGSNTPLFAAVEILLYGLLFVWSKEHRDELGYAGEGQPLLEAKSIRLEVLAPSAYYDAFALSDLSDALNRGLGAFGRTHSLDLTFSFTAFRHRVDADSAPDEIRAAVCGRRGITY